MHNITYDARRLTCINNTNNNTIYLLNKHNKRKFCTYIVLLNNHITNDREIMVPVSKKISIFTSM